MSFSETPNECKFGDLVMTIQNIEQNLTHVSQAKTRTKSTLYVHQRHIFNQ